MKKFSLFTLIGSITLMSFIELSGSEKIYRYLENQYDAFSMSLSKEITDFFDLDVDFNGKEKWITGDFRKGKLLFVKNLLDAEPVNKMFLKEGYENISLDEQREIDDGEVYLFVMRDKERVSEAHFVVEEDEKLILFSVFGDMKVQEK